jgi:hypothetical protein
VVVAPEFMKGHSRDISAIGWLSTSDTTGSAEAIVAELPGIAAGPATAVFRNFVARKEDYFPDSSGSLTDSTGRSILLTEGFIFKLGLGQVAELGLTTADMRRAHELVAPSFREFWRLEDDYPQQYSDSFAGGKTAGAGTPLTLRQRRKTVAEQVDRQQPARSDAYAQAPVTRESVSYDRPAGSRRRARRASLNWRLVIAAAAAIGAIALIVLAVVSLIPSSPAPRVARAARVELTSFCENLKDGHTHAAYSSTTPAYQATESEQAFTANTLGGYTRADSCTYSNLAAAGPRAGVATLAITTGIRPAHHRNLVYEWTVKLIKDGKKWLISELKPER